MNRHPWLQSTAAAKRASMLEEAESVLAILKASEGSDDVNVVLIVADALKRMQKSATDVAVLEQFFETEHAKQITRLEAKINDLSASNDPYADTYPPPENDTEAAE